MPEVVEPGHVVAGEVQFFDCWEQAERGVQRCKAVAAGRQVGQGGPVRADWQV